MFKRKRNGKSNNRGSAMVMVIIAIALVSILVAVIMIMTTLNLQMKYTERMAKRNFYSAENAMEEIKAGLEIDVSNAAGKAFNSIQHQYSKLTEAERVTNFRLSYINTLRDSLKDGTDTKYKLSKLDGYVDQTQFSAGTMYISSLSGCEMKGLAKGLVLYGVQVEYTDDKGYYSKVNTDFVLTIPDLKFTQSAVMPDVFTYSLVANEGIDGKNSNVKFENGVYAGKEGIKIDGASNWQFNNMYRFICGGTAEVKNGARLTVNAGVNFWTKDILVDSGDASLFGRTYVADDLAVRGKNSNVTIRNEYYGYGNGTELKPDGSFPKNKNLSSAMLINGLNSSLDMTKLNKLVLAGRAGIATGGKEVTPPDENTPGMEGIKVKNENIPLAESIEIKSNQIAYLVPAECIGVSDDETIIGRNPMSAEDYKNLLACMKDTGNYPNFKEVSLSKIIEKTGKTLNDYNAGGSLKFQKIFQQVGSEIVVYYYLILDEQNAVNYFADYYSAQQKKLDSYMKKYTNKLLLNDKISRLVLGGNIVTYDGENFTLRKLEDTLTTEEANKLKDEQSSYMRVFAAYNYKLIANYGDLTDAEKTKDVFSNLVKVSEISSKKEYFLDIAGGKTIRAVVTDGNYEYTSAEKNKKVCLIIAEGNVEVKADFQGLIIAKGQVTIDNSVSVKADKDNLVKMLQCRTDTADVTSPTIIEKYFVDGSSYVLEGTVIEEVEDKEEETYLNLTDYVQYENWKKE